MDTYNAGFMLDAALLLSRITYLERVVCLHRFFLFRTVRCSVEERSAGVRRVASLLKPSSVSVSRASYEQIESQLGQSQSCPLRGGPLELGLMSVAKLQVSLVRLVRFTMLELLPLCLFMDL